MGVEQVTDSNIDSSSKSTAHSHIQSSLLWEKQVVLAFFGAIFAVLYTHTRCKEANSFKGGME